VKTDPSVGTEREKEVSAAPMNVIWAWNWRGSEAAGAGAAVARGERRMVRVFMERSFIFKRVKYGV